MTDNNEGDRHRRDGGGYRARHAPDHAAADWPGSWIGNADVHRARHHGVRRGRHAAGAGADRRFSHDPIAGGERYGRHRHGGRRRIFDHGDLRFILLRMIGDKAAHGYDLIKALEERMGGGYSPSPGVIYPTLTLLEEQGYASVTADGGKKMYHATPEGRSFLQANQASVDAIESRIDGIARDRHALPPAPLVRAVENLKTALRLRLAAGPIAEDRIGVIAAAIDAAAAEAERG